VRWEDATSTEKKRWTEEPECGGGRGGGERWGRGAKGGVRKERNRVGMRIERAKASDGGGVE